MSGGLGYLVDGAVGGCAATEAMLDVVLNTLPGPIRWMVSGRLKRFRWLRASIPPVLEADVSYTLHIARSYLRVLTDRGLNLSDIEILELGPGQNLGAQLILASHGARVTVADRYLTPWDRTYHPRFYARLHRRWDGPASALEHVIAARGYPESAIRCVPIPIERFEKTATRRFDVVLSNAVLEHIYDPRAACHALARITKPDGIHFHQIDLRDHKNFLRPLEFLIDDDESYRREFDRRKGGRGNRWRLSEWVEEFKKEGFTIESAYGNDFIPDDYSHAFLPRLRTSSSRYRDWPVEDLRIVGAYLTLTLPSRPISPHTQPS